MKNLKETMNLTKLILSTISLTIILYKQIQCMEDVIPKIEITKVEIESFCKVVAVEEEEALAALQNLKLFINSEDSLSFCKLRGGDCNAPILISKLVNFDKIPLGVLKYEPDISWAEKRMKALDEMRKNGYDQLPQILKDIEGNYLVKLGESFFSCIEYFEPDSDQSSSIEQMFMIASRFHTYSNRSSWTEELRSISLDNYSNENSSNLDLKLIQWNSSLFKTEAWQNCVKCAQYFTSQSFLKIYNRLPVQLIHGDITPNNTIISQGRSFVIDLDKVRTDVRLLDFATFSGWSFLEQYLKLTEEQKLFSCIQMYYGNLEVAEYEYFSLIVLYVRCCVLEWSLRELKHALNNDNVEKEQQFAKIFKDTIKEINEIYKRIPQIKEILNQ